MLVENTLWGKRDKVKIAIERLRQFEPEEGYYLAFSGGKDSIKDKSRRAQAKEELREIHENYEDVVAYLEG